MHLPVIKGVIARRILANFRVKSDVAARLLPSGLKPKLVEGSAIAGICLIRLEGVMPQACVIGLGLSSENAAHRIAVVRDDGADAVYVWRRDTNSRLTSLAGGRLFPGVSHHAKFTIKDDGKRVDFNCASKRGPMHVRVLGAAATKVPATSVFGDLETASKFFLKGSLGYSPQRRAGKADAMELRCETWPLKPLAVEEIDASFFNDPERFPRGSVELDAAFIMRDVRHTWHRQEPISCGPVCA